MINDPLPRLDRDEPLRQRLLRHCRLGPGAFWDDPLGRHRVGCIDAAQAEQVGALLGSRHATLAVQDPPYNFVAFQQLQLAAYLAWCRRWLDNTLAHLSADASLYVWLGADQKHDFQPLPDFMLLMRDYPQFQSRSFITLRNQRGYGTQKNWMSVRQELLYYVRGQPVFHVQYTGIPKILRGYYKDVAGARTENLERSRSDTIRPGNVWVDVQQIFYRLEENVSGCYAQKPLQAVERIVAASSDPGDVVIDWFAHSGTTLLACERLGRACFTADNDPLYCEIAIRRLEHFRKTGKLGWQNGNPFPNEA